MFHVRVGQQSMVYTVSIFNLQVNLQNTMLDMFLMWLCNNKWFLNGVIFKTSCFTAYYSYYVIGAAMFPLRVGQE